MTEEQEKPTGTGFVLSMKEADGGLVLELVAPHQNMKRLACVTGRGGSENLRKSVERKCRAMLKDWTEAVFGDQEE
jgi:hypothetical protein